VRTGRPRHLKTFDYIGIQRYSLTFCTDRRSHLFADRAIIDLVLAQISRAAAENQFAVIAYCFMPDHVRLLEGQSDASDCKRFITRSKQYSGFQFSQVRGGRLWQRYGFERVLRDDEDTLIVARYIVANPVRAHLAACVQDYPFVGSLVYSLDDLVGGLQFAEQRRSG
jgi:putative transposase